MFGVFVVGPDRCRWSNHSIQQLPSKRVGVLFWKVGQTASNGRGRAARRPARHATGGRRIERRAVKVVLADQAEGQLVGHRLADAMRPGRQQLLDAHRMHGCRRRCTVAAWAKPTTAALFRWSSR